MKANRRISLEHPRVQSKSDDLDVRCQKDLMPPPPDKSSASAPKMSSLATKLDRKALGAYYTPPGIAKIMAAWAIRSPDDMCLEPSFGGCCFIEAMLDRLALLGNAVPTENIYGCDVDPCAFEALGQALGEIPLGHFVQHDFLSTDTGSFPGQNGRFDCVIGNPPFVSLHNMSARQLVSVRKAARELGVDGRASLWCYFLMKSLTFLRKGSRLAFIVPLSFCHAGYSRVAVKRLEASFVSCRAIRLKERMFKEFGTDEEVIILLCSGFGNGACTLGWEDANDQIQLQHLTAGTEPSKPGENSSALDNLISRIKAERPIELLGEVFNVRIGLVTGANKFFILTREMAKSAGIPRALLTPTLSSMKNFTGLRLQKKDMLSIEARHIRSLLLDISCTTKLPQEVAVYLASFDGEKRKANITFAKRDPWYVVQDNLKADAFFTYMNHTGPRIVVNDAEASCTNSIHRLTIRPNRDRLLCQAACLALQSSFGQMMAELTGRRYSSGVLKFEPSEARKIPLILPDVSDAKIADAFGLADSLSRVGDTDGVRAVCDHFTLGSLSVEVLPDLEDALTRFRSRRGELRG